MVIARQDSYQLIKRAPEIRMSNEQRESFIQLASNLASLISARPDKKQPATEGQHRRPRSSLQAVSVRIQVKQTGEADNKRDLELSIVAGS